MQVWNPSPVPVLCRPWMACDRPPCLFSQRRTSWPSGRRTYTQLRGPSSTRVHRSLVRARLPCGTWTCEGTGMRFLDSRAHEVESLAFSPDARFLTVGGKYRFLEVWNPSYGERLERLRVHGPVSHLQFHPHRPVAFAVIGLSACVLSHAGGTLSVVREFRPY